MAARRLADGGQALVEFALVLPVLLLLFFALLDFGRAVYAYNTIANSARSAGRVAIVDQTTTKVKDAAIAQAVALGASGSDVTVCYKTASSTQQDCAAPGTQACPTPVQIGCLALVTVRYQFTGITPVISTLIGPVEIASTTRLPVERTNPTSSP